MITTPPSIKSLMLKFVENLTFLTDPNAKSHAEDKLRLETEVWHDVLGLFRQGVVVMDEVDWVLHPLKSELNFPVGEKVLLDMTNQGERWRLPMTLIDALLFAEERIKQLREGHSTEQRQTPISLPAGYLRNGLPERMPRGNKAEELVRQLIRSIDAGFRSRALQSEPHMVLLREDFYNEGDQWKPSYDEGLAAASGAAGGDGRGSNENGPILSLRAIMAEWLLLWGRQVRSASTRLTSPRPPTTSFPHLCCPRRTAAAAAAAAALYTAFAPSVRFLTWPRRGMTARRALA